MGRWLARVIKCVLALIFGALAELVYLLLLLIGGLLALIAEIVNLIKIALNKLPFINFETRSPGSYLGGVWGSFKRLSGSIYDFIRDCW